MEIRNLVQLLECSERLKAELGNTEITPLGDLGGHEREHRAILQVLAERLVAVEAMHREVVGKIRIAQAAEAEWRMVMRARDRAVFVNAAGEIADIPTALMDVLAAGRAADVRVEKTEAGVVIDDDLEERVTVPFSFFNNLPRLVKQWNPQGNPVPVSPVSRDEARGTDQGGEPHGD